MEDKPVVIINANNRAGAHVIHTMEEAGLRVFAVDKKPPKASRNPRVMWCELDSTDIEIVKHLCVNYYGEAPIAVVLI